MCESAKIDFFLTLLKIKMLWIRKAGGRKWFLFNYCMCSGVGEQQEGGQSDQPLATLRLGVILKVSF